MARIMIVIGFAGVLLGPLAGCHHNDADDHAHEHAHP
jgi:hypothetical protein